MYKPQSISDIQEMLKDMFADTIEDMMKAELDSEFGYSKYEQKKKETNNRRNGSYPKTVTSNMGDIALDIPRDRDCLPLYGSPCPQQHEIHTHETPQRILL